MSITGENNTIDKANEAVNKHNLSMYKEEFTRNIMEEKLENGGTIDTSTIDTSISTASGNTDEEKLTNHYNTLKNYVPSIKREEAINWAIIGGELKYTDITNEKEFEAAAELNMADLSEVIAGEENLKVESYIKYTPGAGTYTAKKEQTGYGSQEYIDYGYETPATTDQTYTTDGLTAEDWRVLSVKGTEVTIVREELLPELTLFGQTGYDNAVQELNKICGIYKDNKYAKEARSITVEDVNGVTGYSSSDMAAYNGGSSNSEGGYGYKAKDNGTEYTSDYYKYEGTSTSKQLKTTDEEYKMIFGNSSDINYWIASRCVSVVNDVAHFRVRAVYGGNVGTLGMYGFFGADAQYSVGVRPVVVLKSNVTIKEGSGTDVAPYIMN